ncbi:MAG TPA: hypothetical protein VH325_04455 [Bryobacteraceae bacterium]|jgi:hypothetical protein|nr:hypothetical protein [Bryobacteraceae bacterium]
MGAPTDYLDRYHRLQISDSRLSLSETVNVTNYCSGEAPERSQEQWLLTDKLRQIIDAKLKALPSRFKFPSGDPSMDPNEPFYFMSLRRAFLGKGSPDEISDTLRLAVRAGRIGPKGAAANCVAYVKKFIGIDCNAFQGNYLGLDPEIKPRLYAKGVKGVTAYSNSLSLSFPFLPLTARPSADTVRSGDVLITVVDADDHHEHIALVDNVSSPKPNQLTLDIVEWGQAGERDKHIVPNCSVTIVTGGPEPRYGVSFRNDAKTAHRYFFAPPATNFNSAGIGRCGQEDA